MRPSSIFFGRKGSAIDGRAAPMKSTMPRLTWDSMVSGEVKRPTVTTAAVNEGQIDLERITLIGVFGTDDARRAILRTPDGDFTPIARGSVVDGWRVLTIDRESVRIARGSDVLVLQKP